MERIEPTNVLTAFEMLLEEVENEIEFVNSTGARAFSDGDYSQVDSMRTLAEKLANFRERAGHLRQDWQALASLPHGGLLRWPDANDLLDDASDQQA